jgi:hypothetical protein
MEEERLRGRDRHGALRRDGLAELQSLSDNIISPAVNGTGHEPKAERLLRREQPSRIRQLVERGGRADGMPETGERADVRGETYVDLLDRHSEYTSPRTRQ